MRSAWADLFARSISAGLKPWRNSDLNVYASTGYVGREASEYWGSNQAALALAIWSTTRRVCHYPDTYNVPLHLMMDRPDLRTRRHSPLMHAHYHWAFTESHYQSALDALGDLGATSDRLDWLAARLPIL